jgi:hypothetical protein
MDLTPARPRRHWRSRMTPEEQKGPLAAMNAIVDAYEAVIGQGVSPETVANAALSSALGLLVQIHGEEIVAKMIEEIPTKIRSGVFTHQS